MDDRLVSFPFYLAVLYTLQHDSRQGLRRPARLTSERRPLTPRYDGTVD